MNKARDKEIRTHELMRRTGKGKLAGQLALALVDNDMDKAIERMKSSYPSMEVKK